MNFRKQTGASRGPGADRGYNEARLACPLLVRTPGTPAPVPSTDVVIDAPEIAENGAVVPIEITSKVPGTSSIVVLIDKNPFPLLGKFDFMEGALPFVKVNVKMGETSDVRVIAQAGGKSYVATKEVKVTIGGCGG